MSAQRVLVAMSGGVDSSVAACLLHEQGYDVVGVFMRLGAEAKTPVACATDDPASPGASASGLPLGGLSLPVRSNASDRHRGCCSAADATDARVVAGRLGIPFYALNFEADFSRLIDYFADEYAAARTPNPCVRCNQWLKFGRLLAYAEVVQADLIATGHYSRVIDGPDGPRLGRARDVDKDQSYVLFGIDRAVLPRIRFPLGDLTKAEVRAHARRLGLEVHDKPESQDICFVPDRAYARVVAERRPDAFRPGEIRHVDGRLLGHHDGLANFTVGQRRGLRIALGTPAYVTALDAATDTVYIGPREALASGEAIGAKVSWLVPPPDRPIRADVQIRYHHAAAPGTVHRLDGDRVRVEFDEPQLAVTPGQAMVFYDGDTVLGGGWIESGSHLPSAVSHQSEKMQMEDSLNPVHVDADRLI